MTAAAAPRVLVAGIGNVFLGDDGFGVEVVRSLDPAGLPAAVRVADYGIRGMHLAYDLLAGYDTTILVDATSRGGRPGTLYVIQADPAAHAAAGRPAQVDAHGMQPDAVFRLLAQLGGDPGTVLIVGCEPASTEEGMGLSPAVADAVPEAARIVTDLARSSCPPASTSSTEV